MSLKELDEKAERAAYLIAGYIKQTLTPEEHDELDARVVESDDNMRLFEELTDEESLQKIYFSAQQLYKNIEKDLQSTNDPNYQPVNYMQIFGGTNVRVDPPFTRFIFANEIDEYYNDGKEQRVTYDKIFSN